MATLFPTPIRVFLVKDEPVTREGLRLLLNSQPGITVVGEVSNCLEGIATVIRDQPDIVLMDIDLEDQRGLHCIQEIRRVAAFAHVIILTGANSLESHHMAVTLGARGLVQKSETSDILVKAIKRVHAGEVWLYGMLMARVLDEMWFLLAASQAEAVTDNHNHFPAPPTPITEEEIPKSNGTTGDLAKIALLTDREREIVSLIGRGLRNKEIADRLFISVVTVRHHLSSVFDKLEVSDRFGLAIYAFRHGLAKIPNSTNVLEKE